MKNVIITFRIKPSASLEFVRQIIREFIAAIRQKEPNTLSYRSLQDTEDPYSFHHLMTFADEDAQQIHRASSHCSNFISQLYPLCIEAPLVRNVEEIKPQ